MNDRPARWLPERDAELTRHWNNPTLSSTQIGVLMGVSKNTILGRGRRLGLGPKPNPAMAKWTDEQLTRAKAMVADGESFYHIGHRIGLSVDVIMRRARREQWPGAVRAPRTSQPAHLPAGPGVGLVEYKPSVQTNRRPPRLDSNSGHYAATGPTTCRWLDGEPKDQNYCPDERLPGKAWCLHHYNRAYWRPAKKSA